MKLLTLARDLRRRKARERHELFVAEGVRTAEELLRSAFVLKGAVVSPQLALTPRGAALLAGLAAKEVTMEEVGDHEFASAAETESPQGIVLIGTIPTTTLANLPRADSLRLLILDAVQDPGNVGTIVRTAAALGATATFSLPGTVDLWNAKVVRSGMGAHFHHPCLHGTWDDLDAFRRQQPFELWVADAHGDPVERIDAPKRLALVVGNEGAGLSSSSRSRADRVVALSISAAVESINVAVATGILLYEFR